MQIFSIILAAWLFGAIANFSAAEPDSDWQSNMGPGMMGEMMDDQYKLQEFYDADKQDSAAINKQ